MISKSSDNAGIVTVGYDAWTMFIQNASEL